MPLGPLSPHLLLPLPKAVSTLPSFSLSSLPGRMTPVLTFLAFLLLLGTGAEEIIGGHEVKPHSCPYMAHVKFVKVDGNRSVCGGFLVQDCFVLTAAHCNGRSMKVILGAHNFRVQEKTQQTIPVKKVIPHPAYNRKDHINDIMLLKLESKAKKTRAVRPLNLPRPNDKVKPGDVCHVAGWGQMSINVTKRTSRLQEAKLIIQEDKECKNFFHHYSETTEICAGDPKKIQATYKGDSGEPLMCDNRAYGVIAYGRNGTISSGVFTKVVYFLPWISRNMKLL